MQLVYTAYSLECIAVALERIMTVTSTLSIADEYIS